MLNIQASYDKILKQKKYVDILVNNAAVANDKDIDLSIDVNFVSILFSLKKKSSSLTVYIYRIFIFRSFRDQ